MGSKPPKPPVRASRPCPPEHRTIYPRTHVREAPLTPGELAQAREAEKARQKWDPDYITAEEARSIPPEALESQPDLRGRIERSQPDWPEHRMAASQALGDLPAGNGEQVERRDIPALDVFKGGKQ